MNMGTPGHPEGVPHWSNKAVYSHELESHRKRQQGFWVFFKDCCGQCEGGAFVENILTDVTAVKSEADYGDYRPDILLERGDKPPIFLEFTDTSPPSASKLDYCADNGIDVFDLEGSQRPVDSWVRKAHISLRNCRKRQRQQLFALWQRLENLDDPIVGIKEDFRSPGRKRREFKDSWAEAKKRRQDIADGKVNCARCDKPFTIQGGGFSLQCLVTHRPDGDCGEVPFCDECNLAVMGGWDGVYPDDAGSWGLDEKCPACRPFLAEWEKLEAEAAVPRKQLWMTEPYGRRLVQEPERRWQTYIVGDIADKPVSRSELQAILAMFVFIPGKLSPAHSHARRMLNEVDKIQKAVLYANNIYDLDWLEGVGESYVPNEDGSIGSKGDKFLYLKRWWPELPPYPLAMV